MKRYSLKLNEDTYKLLKEGADENHIPVVAYIALLAAHKDRLFGGEGEKAQPTTPVASAASSGSEWKQDFASLLRPAEDE